MSDETDSLSRPMTSRCPVCGSEREIIFQVSIVDGTAFRRPTPGRCPNKANHPRGESPRNIVRLTQLQTGNTSGLDRVVSQWLDDHPNYSKPHKLLVSPTLRPADEVLRAWGQEHGIEIKYEPWAKQYRVHPVPYPTEAALPSIAPGEAVIFKRSAGRGKKMKK